MLRLLLTNLAIVIVLYIDLSAVADDDRNVLGVAVALVERHYIRSLEFERTPDAKIEELLLELDSYCEWFSPEEAEEIRDSMHGQRATKPQSTVHGRRLFDSEAGKKIDWCDERLRIAYLRIDAFGADTAREMRAGLFQLNEAEAAGLILDLRFNQGGLLSEGVEVADLFLDEGEIVNVVRRNGLSTTERANRGGSYTELPLFVLVNRNTASTAEVLAAALQDAGRASIAGERTRGKGSLQNLFDLPDGGMLKLTTAQLHRPSGETIDRAASPDAGNWGVSPDADLAWALSDAEYHALAKQWYDAPAANGLADETLDRQLARAVQSLTERSH